MNWWKLFGLEPSPFDRLGQGNLAADDLPPNLRRDLNTDYLMHWDNNTGELVYKPYEGRND